MKQNEIMWKSTRRRSGAIPKPSHRSIDEIDSLPAFRKVLFQDALLGCQRFCTVNDLVEFVDHSTFLFLEEFHWHAAQLGKGPTPSQQGPPIVKIDLHWSPHGDPSGNGKALPYDGSPSAHLMT